MYSYKQINIFNWIQEHSDKIQYYNSNKTFFVDKLSINKKQINLRIAVYNYINSIGPQSTPESNHYIKGPNLNDYEKALKS